LSERTCSSSADKVVEEVRAVAEVAGTPPSSKSRGLHSKSRHHLPQIRVELPLPIALTTTTTFHFRK
jgi:hypothetical protein